MIKLRTTLVENLSSEQKKIVQILGAIQTQSGDLKIHYSCDIEKTATHRVLTRKDSELEHLAFKGIFLGAEQFGSGEWQYYFFLPGADASVVGTK